MRKLSCVVAVIGPMLLITILSAVTWQMNQQRTISFDASAYAIWMLVMGLLVGLYLALTLVVLPKCSHPYAGYLCRDWRYFGRGAGCH